MSEEDKLDFIAAILAVGQMAGSPRPGMVILPSEAVDNFLATKDALKKGIEEQRTRLLRLSELEEQLAARRQRGSGSAGRAEVSPDPDKS